jgi:hypothetical protein
MTEQRALSCEPSSAGSSLQRERTQKTSPLSPVHPASQPPSTHIPSPEPQHSAPPCHGRPTAATTETAIPHQQDGISCAATPPAVKQHVHPPVHCRCLLHGSESAGKLDYATTTPHTIAPNRCRNTLQCPTTTHWEKILRSLHD